MRYPPEYKEKARKKVVSTAGALAKKNGFGTTGVDALMKAAGFTTGAFYSHFGSREELLKAIVENELSTTTDIFKGKDTAGLLKAFQVYLSESHLQHPEQGCLLPSLTAEVARASDDTKQQFEALLLEAKSAVEPALNNEGDAWKVISQAVGALMIARAMANPETQKEILDSAKENISEMLSES